MLTGNTPFHAESLTGMLFSILNEPPKGLDAVNPALQPILYRALAKDPERRYESCAELLADLAAAEKQIPADEADADVTQKLPSPVRGNRTSAHTKRLIEEASRGAWGPAAKKSSARDKLAAGRAGRAAGRRRCPWLYHAFASKSGCSGRVAHRLRNTWLCFLSTISAAILRMPRWRMD